MDGVHLGGEELQPAAQVALLADQRLLLPDRLAVLLLQGLGGGGNKKKKKVTLKCGKCSSDTFRFAN